MQMSHAAAASPGQQGPEGPAAGTWPFGPGAAAAGPYSVMRINPAQASIAGLRMPASTLGIEVTIPALARLCDQGNIDPQHGGGDIGLAAIEVALHHPLPPPGTSLVTVRPDADAYGAMAVLALRAEGVTFTPAMRARIALIAREDSFLRGTWPGCRALPVTAAEVDEVGVGPQGHGALVGGLMDPCLPADAGVRAVAAWILQGHVPPAWIARAEAAAARLVAGLEDGSLRLDPLADGGMVLVRGGVPGALRLGYRMAPIVVAEDCQPRGTPPMAWRRVSVAQWNDRFVDLRRAAVALSSLEPGWGGSATIIGSPQQAPTRLPRDLIIAILEEARHDAGDR